MSVLTPEETKQKIRSLLTKKGMTVKDLICLTGDNLNLYKYINGKSATISADRLAKIASALGVSADVLLFKSDTTGRRLSLVEVSSYLGLSESSVRWIRSLDKISKTGLDSAISKNKHTRTSFGALLQLIGEDTLSPVESERDYLMFRACRVVCKLIDKL